MKRGVAVALLVIGFLPLSVFAQCTMPTSTAGNRGNGDTMQTTSTTSGPNFGFYEWDEASQSWMLAEQAWLVEAESETLLEGDYYFPPSTYNGAAVLEVAKVKSQSTHSATETRIVLPRPLAMSRQIYRPLLPLRHVHQVQHRC